MHLRGLPQISQLFINAVTRARNHHGVHVRGDMVSPMQTVADHLAEHLAVSETLARSEDTHATIDALVGVLHRALDSGGKIMFCGNGGSAADSQHLATELTVRFERDRDPFAAIALSTDSSALTAAGNDLGFDQVFSRQVRALGRPGDVLVVFSTSGNSVNVIRAAEEARRMGIHVAFFGGGDGGRVKSYADSMILAPSGSTARIQECHILLGHIVCSLLEEMCLGR